MSLSDFNHMPLDQFERWKGFEIGSAMRQEQSQKLAAAKGLPGV